MLFGKIGITQQRFNAETAKRYSIAFYESIRHYGAENSKKPGYGFFLQFLFRSDLPIGTGLPKLKTGSTLTIPLFLKLILKETRGTASGSRYRQIRTTNFVISGRMNISPPYYPVFTYCFWVVIPGRMNIRPLWYPVFPCCFWLIRDSLGRTLVFGQE